jgi:hypothetical protein
LCPPAHSAWPHNVTVDGFRIERTPVTNREFRKFVNETRYVTFAEIAPDVHDYPGALPHMLKAGSLVFTPPKHAVDLSDWSQWWQFKFDANWRRPYGPRSSISGMDDHPVVHIAYPDAEGRPPGQSWWTFLRNHTPEIAAMDLFVVPTLAFSLLYGFIIVRLDRRELVWVGVTNSPTAEWIARQITEAFPWESAPGYLIRDRDRVLAQS